MKYFSRIINTTLPLLMALFILPACEKNELYSTATTEAGTMAQAKIFVLSAYQSRPALQIKVNDERVFGVAASQSNPTPFPGGGLNTGGGSTNDYVSITPGAAVKIGFSVPKAGTITDSLELGSATFNLAAGSKQTIYFADTAANTASLAVLDTLSPPDSGFAKYKFVNMMPDAPSLDLYIGTVKVASAIPYKGVSPSFVLPTNNVSTTWGIRLEGAATNLVTYANASSIGNQRVYTVIARGYNAVTSTAATEYRRRAISLTYNL